MSGLGLRVSPHPVKIHIRGPNGGYTCICVYIYIMAWSMLSNCYVYRAGAVPNDRCIHAIIMPILGDLGA